MSQEQARRYVEHCVHARVGIEREKVQHLLPGTEAEANRFVIEMMEIIIRPRLASDEEIEDAEQGERRLPAGGKRTKKQRTAHGDVMRAWWAEHKRRKAELNGI